MDEKHEQNENPKKNVEGYSDMTPHEAIKNMNYKQEIGRVHKLVHTIFYICNLAGFDVVERIVLRDRKTGKIWK